MTHPMARISDQLQKAFVSIENLQKSDRMANTGVRESSDGRTGFPDINILETESSYILSINTPGINPGNILVSVTKGVLTLRDVGSGRFTRQDLLQKMDQTDRGQRKHREEFRQGLNLPENVLPNKVTVDTSNGLLRVTLSKSIR